MFQSSRRRGTAVVVTLSMLSAMLTVAAITAVAPIALAANDGSLNFSKSGPGSILYGEDATYTLTASNNGGGVDGYNLTFRDVLSPGVTFVSSDAGSPTRTIADSPSAGFTTLLFENLADLQVGVTRSIGISVDLSEATYPVGSSVINEGGAFMSSDPRLIPDFDAAGAHVDNADTSAFGTQTTSTSIEAIEITKFEPDAEVELLRGVHTEWTTYSLVVQNNFVNPTNAVTVEDWIPAGLEFLGCGAVDNTDATPVTNPGTGTDEYPGSGALGVGVAPVDPTANAIVATCETPTTVETVTLAIDEQFVGQAAGVYTHVVWDLSTLVGTMAASANFELMYAAGIPLRANTTTFEAAHIDISDDTADLDNNNGALTVDEQGLTNWTRVSGNYNPGVDDLATTDDDNFTVIAEDLSVHKTVDDSVFTQTEFPGWSLLIETGEYRDATNVVVTDTLPDGQCPILSVGDPETTAPISGECAQTGGLPVPIVDGLTDDPDTVTENSDGSWTIVWSTVPDLAINDDYLITFSSRVRRFYQEAFIDDIPVVGADTFVNSVAILGTTTPISSAGTDLDRVVETTLDASSASQSSSVVTIDKSISHPSGAGVTLDCDLATYTTASPPTIDLADPAYRPGDRVCYRIIVDFASDLDYRNPTVTDFIAPNTVFETFWGTNTATGQVLGSGPGADVVIDDVYDVEDGPGGVPDGFTDDGLEWTLGATIPGGGTDLYVDNLADHFEVIFSVLILGDPLDVTTVDIYDNLAKLTIQNNPGSGGETFSSRDQADFLHVEPHLVLDKRNAPSGGITDDGAETGVQLDVFDYEVDITNDFAAGASAAEDLYATAFAIRAWDILPVGFDCTDITAPATVTTGELVTCLDLGDLGYPLTGQTTDARSVLEVTIVDLAPQETVTLSYSIGLPITAAASESHINNAGVRDYTNGSGNAGTTISYYPTSNIDESNTLLENTGAANDTATVSIPTVGATKIQTSGDTDAAGGTNRTNAPASTAQQDATIGETITYTFDVTIPEGTDLYNATVVDSLDSEIDFVSFDSGSMSLDNGATSTALTLTSATDAYFDLDGSTTENAGDISVDVAADVVTVTFPATWDNAVASLDDLLSVTFTTIVRDAAGVDIGDNINNTVGVNWDNLGGSPQTTVTSSNVRTKVVEPNPTVTKSDNGTDTDIPTDGESNVSPGDSITYSVVVTNPDIGTGHTSAAYDLVITDVLPEGVTFNSASGIDNPDGGVFVAGTPVGAEGTITWTQAEVAALAALQVGASITLQYTVTVDNPAVASSRLTNTATVTAESREAESAGERTTYSANDTDTVELPVAQLAKDLAPFDADPFDGTDTDTTAYPVGEVVDFEVTVAVPTSHQVHDATVFDTLPAFVEFESYGTPVLSGAECGRIGGGALGPADLIALTPNGQNLGWYLGDVLASGLDCRITFPYRVHIDSAATTASSGANSATLVWHDANSILVDPVTVTDLGAEAWDETVGPETETITVIEPLLVIDKDVVVLDPGPTTCEPSADADTCDTESSSTHRFTVTVTNNGDGPAHDVDVIDTLPVEGAGNPFNITGSPTPTFDGSGPRTLTWAVTGPIAASGGSVTFTYDVLIGPSSVLADDQDLVNTADVTSYWGMSVASRESSPGVLINPDVPEYGGSRNPVTADVNTLTVEFPDLVIQKTPAAGMDDADARVGEDFRWRLEIFNDGTGAAYDIDVDDVLPTAWLYELGSATLDTGSGAGALADPVGGTTGPLVWTDVVGSLAAGASFVIEYDVQPQASLLTLATTGDFDHVNDSGVDGDDLSGVSTNQTGGYGDDDGVPNGSHGSDDDSARIRRVDLEVAKSIVETAPHFYGDFITYRIVVTNNNSVVAVDSATGVTVLDVLPSEVVYDSSTTANGSYDDGTDTWTLPSAIVPGGSATLDVVVRINAPTAFTNIAEVETADQWDIDSTPGNHDGGTGTDEDDNESVALTPTNADLGNRLWFDVNADGVQDAGEPGIPGVDVTVSWLDPADGVTTVSRTSTTNSEGEYSFFSLPQDMNLTLTVDTVDLPAGLTQTFELIDNPVITNTQAANTETGALDATVAQIMLTGTNPSYLDVDFGWTGSGSLGDYVWYDRNADGVQDGAEVGLDGIDVTVSWPGFDGFLGDNPATAGTDESLDDVIYVTTTAGGGIYGVANLAPGNYTIAVDTADLPNGIDIETWDPEFAVSGDPADLLSVSTYALSAAENHTGVDFGYTGPGSLGDTVWLDLNGDGVVDSGEVGLAGVTVTATFVEPAGSTIVLTMTTAADGTYLFTGLPLGVAITVDVTSAELPDNMTPTHDLDDPADGSVAASTPHFATVTLTSGVPARLDADFGYVGLGSIGDTVWLDLDASGDAAPQPDDVLLPNVTVTLTWTNPGGTDLVLTTTTAADGTYLFEGLPDGGYVVALTPSTLPSGVTPIIDPDGGADHISALTLDDLADLDQDFAYVGIGSIGDLVWNDLDADGTINGGETGLDAIDVTVVWTDPVTGATAIIITSTAADGSYGVGNLPAGRYTVSIDPATLPEGMAPTHDFDGGLDRTTDLVLGAGEDRDDIDFGERREADLQIAKTSAGEFAIGSEATWTLVVTNFGPAIADGVISVSDTVPSGVTPVGVVETDWTCVISGSLISCTFDALSMAVGASSSIDVIVDVEIEAAPSMTNTATVDMSGGPADPNPDNNEDDDVVSVPLALLGIEKVLLGELVINSAADWRIRLTNYGPSDTNGTVTVTDELPEGLGYIRADAPGFLCSSAGRVVTCTTDDVIAVDDTLDLVLTTMVTAAAGTTIVNIARASGGTTVLGDTLPTDVLDGILELIATPGSDLADDLGVSPPSDGINPFAETGGEQILAFTGADANRMLLLAVALILMGMAITGASRRRLAFLRPPG